MRAFFGNGFGAPNDLPASAHAFAAAFVADIEAAPFLKEQLVRGRLTRSALARIVLRDVEGGARGTRGGPPLFPNVRAVAAEFLAQEARPVRGARTSGGMGQWDAITGVIGAAAGAASSIYAAKTNADMQKQLLSLEQQKQKATLAIAELQAKTAQTQLAAANVAATGVPSSSPLAPVLEAVGGWPVVGAAGAAIAIAVAVYFARRR